MPDEAPSKVGGTYAPKYLGLYQHNRLGYGAVDVLCMGSGRLAERLGELVFILCMTYDAEGRWPFTRIRVVLPPQSAASDIDEPSVLKAARDAVERVRGDPIEGNHNWHRGFEPLADEQFFGWHRVLPVLMSLKLGRAVGYDVESSYRVLEAAVRQSTQRQVYGFTVLYLWASSAFNVSLNAKQRQWRKALAEKVKASVEAGEATYRRVTYYDEAIVLLFPALEEKLSSSFAM
jgi:hypothetical protein